MIHTEDLTKQFGDQVAVDRLNLDIAEGEVFGFLGPNGAGKTTTIRTVSYTHLDVYKRQQERFSGGGGEQPGRRIELLQ